MPAPDDLEALFTDTAERLQSAYNRIIRRLDPLIMDFNNAVAALAEREGGITPKAIRQLPEFARLINAVETELTDFATLTRTLSSDLVDRAILLGLDDAQIAVLRAAGLTELPGDFFLPSPDALARLIGIVDSDVFRANWDAFGQNAAEQFADTLLAGAARGNNPRDVARIASNWLGIPYNWAENAARTSMLYAFRHANLLTYRANPDIIQGWRWVASLSDRTCISCWNMHGTVHTLDESLNDHHRGRCTPSPMVIGFDMPMQSGRAAFAMLPEAQQRAIFGNALLFDAWKSGRITWEGLSRPYQDDLYGEMLGPPTAKSLGVKAA